MGDGGQQRSPRHMSRRVPTLNGTLERVILDAEILFRLGTGQIILLDVVVATLSLGHLVLVLSGDPARVMHDVDDILPSPLANGWGEALPTRIGDLKCLDVSRSHIANVNDAACRPGKILFGLAGTLNELPDAGD